MPLISRTWPLPMRTWKQKGTVFRYKWRMRQEETQVRAVVNLQTETHTREGYWMLSMS